MRLEDDQVEVVMAMAKMLRCGGRDALRAAIAFAATTFAAMVEKRIPLFVSREDLERWMETVGVGRYGAQDEENRYAMADLILDVFLEGGGPYVRSELDRMGQECRVEDLFRRVVVAGVEGERASNWRTFCKSNTEE